MFERNRIDRVGEAERIGHSVEVRLMDGTVLIGRVHVVITRSLADELNNASAFIDFESGDGDRTFLAKMNIRTIKLLQIPRSDQLARGAKHFEGLDPASMLKVPASADRETVRDAYHRLVKQYHPDRFSGVELPPEVLEYLASVTRRLNVAYSVMQGNSRAQSESPAHAG